MTDQTIPAAAVLSIGDELTLGEKLDTNSRWLAQRLVTIGYRVVEHATVTDDIDIIAERMAHMTNGGTLLICTGGLGPTADDVTRDALAQVAGQSLVTDDEALAALEAMFDARGLTMTDFQRRQTLRPADGCCLPNTIGTAPGLQATANGATILCLPGPPRELIPMFEQTVEPMLRRELRPRIRVIHSVGIPESVAATRLGELLDRGRDPEVGITASSAVVSIRIRSFDGDPGAYERAIESARKALAPNTFGEGDTTLAEAILSSLRAGDRSLATVESCTGGLIAAALTEVAGSSDVYRGGWVTYSNDLKAGAVDVPSELLELHGAVSAPVAQAMAVGGLRRADADHAVSVTGIAGPGGGSDTKPVGTVWIGHAWRHEGSTRVEARRFRIPGDRPTVRGHTTNIALGLVHLALAGAPDGELIWQVERVGPNDAAH